MTTLSSVTDTVTNTEYINQRRAAQFNVYQEKRYAAYLDILKYFTIYCVILLVLAILRKRMILVILKMKLLNLKKKFLSNKRNHHHLTSRGPWLMMATIIIITIIMPPLIQKLQMNLYL